MERRRFLANGGRVLVGICLLPIAARARSYQPKRSLSFENLIADLEEQIPELMSEAIVPGLSIAIVKDANLAWHRGFGVADAASGRSVNDDTVFEAASTSKTLFAYAVMKLCERGVLSLDTPLTEYTRERFMAGDPRLDFITARHVLSHTSGFQDWRSAKEPLKIHFTPGEKWMYSGEGYEYLQSVVTRLTGHVNSKVCARYEAGLNVCATDIDAYMKRTLLIPFGMASSGYIWNDLFDKHAARPHDERGVPLAKRKPTATDATRYAAAGGLHTTPTDYAKFLIEVMTAAGGDAYRLKKETRDEMVRPQVKVDERTSWALGWQIRHTGTGNIIQHGGDNKGFHAFVAASVEKRSGWIVMTNGDSGWKLFRNQVFWDALNAFLAD
jgi:CubicO group peptidase (beta-lactamase class C family)